VPYLVSVFVRIAALIVIVNAYMKIHQQLY